MPWELRTTGGKGEVVFSFVSPIHLWVLPCLLGTFCLGAICVNCMISGPSYYIKKGNERVGFVTAEKSCGSTKGITKYTSSDPAVLRGCMNLVACQCFWLQFYTALREHQNYHNNLEGRAELLAVFSRLFGSVWADDTIAVWTHLRISHMGQISGSWVRKIGSAVGSRVVWF